MALVPLIGEGIQTAYEVGAEAVDLASNALVKFEMAKEVGHQMVDEIKEIGHDAYGLYEQGQKRITEYYRAHKKRKRDSDVPFIMASRTHKPEFKAMDIPFGRSFGKGRRTTTTVLMPKRKKSSKRYRSSKRRKYATKRSVMALIKRGPSIYFKRGQADMLSQYMGHTNSMTPTQPNPKFGQKVTGVYTWWTEANITSSHASALARMPAAGPTGPIPDDKVKLWITKLRHEWDLYNPMSEDVIAKFWLIGLKKDTSETPRSLWIKEWGQMREVAISNPPTDAEYDAFEKDFFTFPTEFKEWKNYFFIQKKWETLFKPGDNKKLKFKQKPITHVPNEDDLAGHQYLPYKTYFLMWELRGIPTHQNESNSLATQDVTKLSYSPAALDAVHKRTYFVAASRLHGKDVRFSNTVLIPSAGYTNQVTSVGPITTV